MAIRILLVDRTPAYRRGLRTVLAEAGFDVSEAADVPSPDESTAPLADVVVFPLDASRSLEQITAVTAALPATKALAIQTDRDPDLAARALRAGVDGIVDRDAPPEMVVHAVRACLDGHTMLPGWVAAGFAARIPERPPTSRWVTDEEVGWLRLLADGRTVAEVADEVGYSEREMFRNLHDVYARIGARNRTGALLWAERHGLLAPDPDDARPR